MSPALSLRVRPGVAADIPAVARVYDAAFGKTSVVGLLHPRRDAFPDDAAMAFHRLFHARYWGDEEQILLIAVDTVTDDVVGFACTSSLTPSLLSGVAEPRPVKGND